MYFEEILQGITSNLMDSNLFQLKSSTFHKTYRLVLVTRVFLQTHFQASVGLFFLGIPDEQFNLGHWSFPLTVSSMAPRKFTIDRIRTRKAIAKVITLKDKIYRSSGTLVGAKFTKASERLQYLLLLLRYRGVDISRL